MQYPRITKTNLAHQSGIIASLLLALPFAVLSAPICHAQEASAEQQQNAKPGEKLFPVHLWVAGRTLPLKISPLTDLKETYVPLAALLSVNTEYRINAKGDGVHLTFPSRQELDMPFTYVNGKAMLPLSALARSLNASIETSADEPSAKPTFRSPDTVYLLARVTDARFENGTLRIRTSFPVPFHTRMLLETKPIRGYVDCVGAEVPDNFLCASLPDGEKRILKLRAGQNSPTIARVVVELAEGTALRTGDIRTGPTEVAIETLDRPGSPAAASAPDRTGPASAAKVTPGSGVAKTSPPAADGSVKNGGPATAGPGKAVGDPNSQPAPPVPPLPQDQGDRNPIARNDVQQNGAAGAPANPVITPPSDITRNVTPSPSRSALAPRPAPPIEIRGLNIAADTANSLRFYLTTGGKVRPSVRYTPGTTQMLVDIPNAALNLPDSEDADRDMKHPLLSGVHLETIQGAKEPMTRLTLDTSRILGYSLTVQPNSVSLELRVPRNATGVLADKLIVVDPGHGGPATGATGGGLMEKNITLSIAMKLRAELESCGARVIMTRTTDVDVSLNDRSRMGNEIGADLFISIHNDSNERSNSASGTSTYFHNQDPSSRALATCVQHSVMAVTGLPSRGILSDTVMYTSGFAVLRGSAMPAVLCEVAYINNATDRRKLTDPQFQYRVAKAMCDGLRNYVEGTPKRSQPIFARPMPSDTGEKADAIQ